MSSHSRKLILLFDGSSNSTAQNGKSTPTAMYELNQALSNDASQISFYFSGVGTHGDEFSAATGEGLNEIIADAYINLASNFKQDDSIYLFGFSRGAMAARCLSGLISIGLLQDPRLSTDFSKLWEIYQRSGKPEFEERVSKLKKEIKDYLNHPSIEFLGAFDTVPGGKLDKLRLKQFNHMRDFHLAAKVKSAVHLLSVDDTRFPSFQPLLWEGKKSDKQSLNQMWMPGVHADIGGCSNAVFIGNLAVLTMIEALHDKCPELLFDESYIAALEAETFKEEMSIQITYEREGFLKKFLKSEFRNAENGANQFRHYLLQELTGHRLLIRGKTKCYCAKHITKTVKSSYPTRYKAQIDKLISVLEVDPCCNYCAASKPLRIAEKISRPKLSATGR